jgi:hypothetical protein
MPFQKIDGGVYGLLLVNANGLNRDSIVHTDLQIEQFLQILAVAIATATITAPVNLNGACKGRHQLGKHLGTAGIDTNRIFYRVNYFLHGSPLVNAPYSHASIQRPQLSIPGQRREKSDALSFSSKLNAMR